MFRKQPKTIILVYFSGLCLERPGCECIPKKTRHVKINIVMGVNSSSTFQVCSSIDIEEHRGPCRCKCMIKSCHYNKVFDRDSCQCMCKDSFAILKSDCLTKGGGRQTNFWDEDTCSCKCKPRRCVKGHYQGIICSKSPQDCYIYSLALTLIQLIVKFLE